MDKPVTLKSPTTFEEQLNLLRERGLIVEDNESALMVLRRMNYYRFTAYALTFKIGDRFKANTTFNLLYRHYEFDMELRILLLEIIEPIEIAFRTHVSYQIAHTYGSEGHKNVSNFANPHHHASFLKDLDSCINKSIKDLFVRHHIEHYEGRFPVWVATETITIAMLSKLFSNLKTSDKKKVALNCPELYYKDVSSILHVLTVVRNRCAHYSRLFNRFLPAPVKLPTPYKHLKFPKTGLFAAIIGIKHLSTQEAWNLWKVKLENLFSRYPEVDITRIGFPANWQAILNK